MTESEDENGKTQVLSSRLSQGTVTVELGNDTERHWRRG